MVKRLSGLVMIVNTLLPFIIVLGLAVVGNHLGELFAAKLKQPAQNMTSALAVLQEEANRARLTIMGVTAEVTQNISAAKLKLDAAAAGVAAATNRIDTVVTPITNFSVPIPGKPKLQERKPTRRNPIPYEVKIDNRRVKPFKDLDQPFVSLAAATTQALDASTEIKKTVEAVKKLGPLADIFDQYKIKFDALAQQIKTVANIFSELGESIAFVLKIGAIIVLPWLALSYVLWGYRRLTVGWSLLQARG